MTDKKVSSEAMRQALKQYSRELLRYKRYFIPSFILPGVGSVLALYVPALVVAKILDVYQSGQTLSSNNFITYLLVFTGVWLLGELLWRVSEWFNEQGQFRAMQNLYIQALTDLLSRDVTFFNDNFAGSLTKRALDYASNFEDFADKLSKNFTGFIITFCFSFVILWQFSPWLSLALTIIFIITLRGSLYFIRRRKPIIYKRNAASNQAAGVIADIIANVNTVKTFGHEQEESKRYTAAVNKHMKLRLQSWKMWNQGNDAFVSPMYVLINVAGLIMAIYFGQRYAISAAAVFVTFSYIGRISRSLWELGPFYVQLERNISDAAEHVQAMLSEPRVLDVADASPLVVDQAEIEFRDVNFAYDDSKEVSVFSHFNVTIKPGEKIGLVGPSGGGKTTITKLLLRFMDIQDGHILISGQDIAAVQQHSLRQTITYVPQEPLLFHRTLFENIHYGQLDASKEQVIAAAKMAHAHEFIKDLPRGYDTLVGERGVKLSGGQRQRIAIARAILKDAPILILDEATSALDSASEVLIQDALWKLMKDRTSLVIAHRLSTIQHMDRILVLENGTIVEEGTHKQLLRKEGSYARLWAHQSGGFLKD